ncbi:MAG: diphosphomevalonate decarboxylase [bacterium]|nr:diphosphomevalonate decarboxylase [bacterium]
MKATATAPANIAFIKYWGKKDEKLRLPETGSISMSLDKCLTTTTVEFADSHKADSFVLDREIVVGKEAARVFKQLDRLRSLAGSTSKAKVVSQNNFPKGTGIASSASGFAALTVATASALGLVLSEKELSIYARLGSGSACRSIPEGIVEWLEGDSNETSYAHSLYPVDYWNLRDVLAIVSSSEKKVGSSRGHTLGKKSIFHEARVKAVYKLILQIKEAIKDKDIHKMGEILEADCIYMHAVMMSSTPALFYWNAGTMNVIHKTIELRGQGIPVYFTIDAGPNVHLITEEKYVEQVSTAISKIQGVQSTIINKPAKGARITENHLF